ncbi:hypothetical protein JCM19039_2096 [Geomicrobium sp. JCM 19039]|nr:hypothetical protein JCM19039_2096 [Geomicrobium sp. JCM 19039]
MKYFAIYEPSYVRTVAPCMGAWIEMVKEQKEETINLVAPCTGAWIEISAVCW